MYIKLLYVHMYVKKCTLAMLCLFTECVKLSNSRVAITTTNATTSIAVAATTTTNTNTSKMIASSVNTSTPAETKSTYSKKYCIHSICMYIRM